MTARSARRPLAVSDLAWRYRETARNGRLLYRAENPPGLQLTTALPRVLLQGVFFTLAGRVIGGPAGAQYAFTGVVGYAACTRTIVYVCDIPMIDKLSESYYRLQAATVGPAVIYLLRTLPYLASGILSTLVTLAVGGPLLGLAHLSLRLLPLLPLYVLTACTSTAFGLAVAALAVGGSRDVLFGNLAAYLLLATGAIVAPYPAALRWLGDVGDVVPLAHGLAAIRAHLAGRPWGGQALLEAAAGAGWLAAAVLILRARDRRSRAASSP